MKTKFFIFICIFLLSICFGFAQSDLKNLAKNFLIGRWVLNTDKNFIMDMRSDSVIYYYKGKIDDKWRIELVFEDSLDCWGCYFNPIDSSFFFMGKGSPQFVLSINVLHEDDLIYPTFGETVHILYLTKDHLEFAVYTGSIPFTKEKKRKKKKRK